MRTLAGPKARPPSRRWVALAVAVVALGCTGAPAGARAEAEGPGPGLQPPPAAVAQASGPAASAPDAPAPDTAEAELVVRGVVVRDLDGRVAWRGDVDLGPVLARIARGQRDPHRDDGAEFFNRERRLPSRPRGWYREYVVRTPGLRSVGPQRLVLGRDGEAYYTADHYRTFTPVRRAHGR